VKMGESIAPRKVGIIPHHYTVSHRTKLRIIFIAVKSSNLTADNKFFSLSSAVMN
jgi:hypothetical protein